MSRITNDVGQVQRSVSETLGDLTRESLALVGITGLLFYYDARLAIVCLTGAARRLSARPARPARAADDAAQPGGAGADHACQRRSVYRPPHRQGLRRRGARGGSVRARVRSALYRTSMTVTSALSALPPLMEFIGGIAAVGAIAYGSRRSRGRLRPAQFTSFHRRGLHDVRPVKKLSRVNADLQQAMAAAERIFEMLDTHSEVRERPDATALPRLREMIEFRDVGFAYDDRPDRFVLRHVSLTVRAGQVVALVGLSGAGKTTLVNLIPRFFDVTEGAILIDGVDIRDVTLKSLRDQIALVTQETVLFDDTIAANIAYGAPTRPRADRGGRPRRARRRVHRRSGRRLRRAHRRARPAAVGRPAAAAGDRARDSEGLSAARARRGDLVARRRIRAARAGRAREPHAQPHDVRHRAPAVDRPPRRRHRRAGAGAVAEIGTHDELVNRPGGVYARLYALQAFGRDRELEPSGAAVRWERVVIRSMTGFASISREEPPANRHRHREVGEPSLPRSRDQGAADARADRIEAATRSSSSGSRAAAWSLRFRSSTRRSLRACGPQRGAARAARPRDGESARGGLRHRRAHGLRRAADSAGARDPRRRRAGAGSAGRRPRWSSRPSPRRSRRWSRCARPKGASCSADLDTRLAMLDALIDDVERVARDGQQHARSAAARTLAALPADLQGDPAALAQEIVRFVARSDVDEELVRLRGHFEHWRGAGRRPGAVRPQARFSRAGDEPRDQHHRIESRGQPRDRRLSSAKAELERVREQVQNVE